MKQILFLLFIILSTVSLYAQGEAQWAKKADQAMQQGDFIAAASYYLTAYKLNEENLIYYYHYGEALKKENLFDKAFVVFESVVAKDPKKSIPEAYFWMAMMEKRRSNYQQAREHFKIFTKQYRRANYQMKRKAKNEIIACDVAQKIVIDTANTDLRVLSDAVNSNLADFGPRLLDSNTLTLNTLSYNEIKQNDEISSKEVPNTVKVYTSTYNTLTKDWDKKKLFDPLVNNKEYNNANICMSKDKKRLYFTRCSDNTCSIYMSEKKGKDWQIPEVLPYPVNVDDYSSTQPFIAENNGKELLFFASNKTGGKGGYDIYYSTISKGGKRYGTPKNLGRKINTLDNEVTPFYDEKNSCLYFSSEWHHGLGGYDIFKSCGSLKSLSVPENIGLPYNSTSNELYYSIYDDTLGFFSSNRPRILENGDTNTCCSDVYAFIDKPIVALDPEDSIGQKIIYKSLEQLNKYLPVTLYFHNDRPNPKTVDTLTALNYITTYESYTEMIEEYKKKYSAGMDGEKAQQAEQEMEDFFFNYVDQGVSDLGMFMGLLEKALKRGGKFNIKIKGYASPLAKSDYNENLTLRRISSLQNYMNEYKNGSMKDYIASGAIGFSKIPFGEYKADTTVSDNLNDKRNSVYSIKAARERKIEVLSVDLLKSSRVEEDKNPDPLQVDSVVQMGKLKYGKKYKKKFKVKNTSDTTVVIYEIESDCSCTVADVGELSIAPGEEVEIPFEFLASKKGEVIRRLNIQYTGVMQHSKIIYVKGTVYE